MSTGRITSKRHAGTPRCAEKRFGKRRVLERILHAQGWCERPPGALVQPKGTKSAPICPSHSACFFCRLPGSPRRFLARISASLSPTRLSLDLVLKQANIDQSHQDEAGAPFISVILPVRNEEPFIASTLNDLLRQQYDPQRFELIVVDGESTDQTCQVVEEIAGRCANVRLLHNPQRWSSAARNTGIRAAEGDFIVVVDGHCEIDNERFLHNLADAFVSSGADCLGRPQPLDVSEATTVQRAIAAARSSRLGHHPESFIYAETPQFVPAKSVAVAYRRGVFQQVGYFDECFDAHEDGEFNHRCDLAGLRCYFTPQIAVRYVPRGNLRSLLRQMIRYGRGRVRFSRKHSGTWGLGALIPALFVLYVLLGGILASAVHTFAVPYVVGLGIYAAVVTAYSIAVTAQERKPYMLFWLPLVFLAIHVGAGVGILAEAIAPKKAVVSPKSARAPAA